MRIGLVYEGKRPDWPIRDLQRHARRLKMELQLIRISDLTAHINSGGVEVILNGKRADLFDGFIVRGLGWPTNLDRMEHRTDLLYCVEAMAKPVMNPAQAIVLARDKEHSLSILAVNGFKVPETFICEDLSTAMRIAGKLGHHVIKPLQGSRGLGVISVEDEDLAFHMLRAVAQTSGVFYLQRYISNLRESFRVFTVGRTALGCVRLRPRRGGWKSNASQGGIPKAVSEFENEARIAVEAANCLGLDYAGVDLLVTEDGQEFIIEVNASPSWRVFSKVTGTEPGRSLLQFLAEKVREAS